MGTVACRTLERLIRSRVEVKSVSGLPPYFLIVQGYSGPAEELIGGILSTLQEAIDPITLLGPKEAPQIHKYDDFVPPALLRKAFAVDHLDIDEVRNVVQNW